MRTSRGIKFSCGSAALLLSLGLVAACGDDNERPNSPVGGSGAMDGGGSGGVGADGGGGVGADGGGGSAGVMDASFDGALPDAARTDGGDNDGGSLDAAGQLPLGWLCRDSLWADGVCDCGCGAFDFDCVFGGCFEPGCNDSFCEACFAANGGWVPCALPAWTCDATELDDANNFCDCGCGAPDPDCLGRGCTTASCRAQSCDRCHDDTNAVIGCQAPVEWLCERGIYYGNDGCDCGCGAIDPDCTSGGCAAGGCDDAACDVCRDGSGDVIPCGVPSDWLCNPLAYDSDDGCDCGCGVPDPDCSGGGCAGNACTGGSCDTCHYDAAVAACTIPPAWNCHPGYYDHNDVCDCGCGAIDPDCASGGCIDANCTATGCDLCHDDGDGFADRVIPCGASTCDPSVFGDGSGPGDCDCGCGVTDADCMILPSCTAPGCEIDTCVYCSDTNGRRLCGSGWTCGIQRYGDGHCDCGCGAMDPDCAGAGCSAPGCQAATCETCLGTNGFKITCDAGTCPSNVLGSGDGCDCGCGVADADCDGLSACTQPGCSASECARCYDPLGRVINCL